LLAYLHEEDVFVAVVLDHVVVQLDEGALLVLLVEIADVARVDFVLGLDGTDQAGNWRRNLENIERME
jgi:hypothetical protein